MTRSLLGFHPTLLAQIKAATISSAKAGAFEREVRRRLIEVLGVHPKAVERWTMGWLTDGYPIADIRIMMASGYSVEDAAQNIGKRIEPYNLARKRMDAIANILVSEYQLIPDSPFIERWILLMDDWDFVDRLNQYCTTGGKFDTIAAAASIAEDVLPWQAERHEEVKLMMQKANELADIESAEELARRETKKLKERYLAELKAKRASGK